MKNVFQLPLGLTCLFLLFGLCLSAQGLQLEWAHALAGADRVSTGTLAVDNQGNVYITGYFEGTIDFDPGEDTVTLTTGVGFGQGSAFLAKYDAQGNFLWVKEFVGTAKAMAVNDAETLFITGTFSGTADFDLNEGVAELTSAGNSDIFVAAYHAQGDYINAFRVGGPGLDGVEDIAFDAAGYFYITGEFNGVAEFDPGPGTHLLESVGGVNVYLAKYSSTGNLIHAFSLDGANPGGDTGVALAIEASGNVILGGRFLGAIDLDPGPGTDLFTAVGLDGFIAKYDPTGNYISGHTYDGNVYFIALDEDENLYVSGTMPDSMDVDPGPGEVLIYSSLPNTMSFDIWIAKYNAQGDYLHAKVLESNRTSIQYGLAVDHQNNLYFAGRFPDTLSIDPTIVNVELYTSGMRDGFLVKFDPELNLLFGTALGSTKNDEIRNLVTGPQGEVWMAGTFYETVDFDFGGGTSNLSSPDTVGIFLAKYIDDSEVGISAASTPKARVNIRHHFNTVYIDFAEVPQINAQVKIMNLWGQTLLETKHAGSPKLEIDLPSVPSQIYLVVVRNGDQTTAKKIWVQN